MVEIVLRACPICGKEPKVKRDYGYESLGFGGWYCGVNINLKINGFLP